MSTDVISNQSRGCFTSYPSSEQSIEGLGYDYIFEFVVQLSLSMKEAQSNNV
jgi:hypothetical protein